MPSSADKRLVSLQEAADIYGVSVKTVRRRIAEGHLPGYRLRGTRGIRVRSSELDVLLRPIPTAGGRK